VGPEVGPLEAVDSISGARGGKKVLENMNPEAIGKGEDKSMEFEPQLSILTGCWAAWGQEGCTMETHSGSHEPLRQLIQ
jgi:hypothetical protein